MFARTLKLLLKPIILLMLILPKFAIGDDMVPYKVLNYVGESSCVFRTLKDRVAESQPRIMGYTPYIWKDKFDDITSLGAIDGMLPAAVAEVRVIELVPPVVTDGAVLTPDPTAAALTGIVTPPPLTAILPL